MYVQKRWTYEDVVRYVELKGSKVLTEKEDFKNTRVNMNFTCSVCGEKITRTFKSFRDQNATTCKKCTNKKLREMKKLSKKEVYNRCNKYGTKLLTPYEQYVNNETPIEFECSCGVHFFRRLADLQNEIDYKCDYCNNHHRYTYKEVYDFIESKGCKLKSNEYKKNSDLLEIECKCGNIFYRRFNNFKDSNQYYCNSCTNNSKAEIIIKNILDKNDIVYSYQHRFNECKNIKPLPFDFYIPSLNIAIEYDGEQHYKIGCFRMDLLDLMNLKRKDYIKTQYCKDNNIKLIRIPYWEFDNIENILKDKLNIR